MDKNLVEKFEKNLNIKVDLKECATCGIEDSKFICCGETYYCSKECQAHGYRDHYKDCKKKNPVIDRSNSRLVYSVYRHLIHNLALYVNFMNKEKLKTSEVCFIVCYEDSGTEFFSIWKNVRIFSFEFKKHEFFNKFFARNMDDMKVILMKTHNPAICVIIPHGSIFETLKDKTSVSLTIDLLSTGFLDILFSKDCWKLYTENIKISMEQLENDCKEKGCKMTQLAGPENKEKKEEK